MIQCLYRGVTVYRFPFPHREYITIFSKARVFVLANDAGPNEAPACAAFHLGLHCLPKRSFVGFRSTND